MSLAAYGALAVLILIAIVSSIVAHEERKERRLGKPVDDSRNWSDAFMRDVRKWRIR